MNSPDRHARFMGMVNFLKERGVRFIFPSSDDPLEYYAFLGDLFGITQPPEALPREVKPRSTDEERWNSLDLLDDILEKLGNEVEFITSVHIQQITRLLGLKAGDQSWVASQIKKKNGGFLYSPAIGWSLRKLVTNKKKDDDNDK